MVAAVGLWGCDQSPREADAAMSRDKGAAAFEGRLEGCAATAGALAHKWAGKPFSVVEPELDAETLADVRVVRVIRPGTMVTKDYRIDRLNVAVEDDETVTKFYCG
tara:strand:- start:2494 stop:2811 length:318 start_codon:yes stop_codon:yes gene_type:complete